MYSVIIPTFNRKPWLLEAVHSVLEQGNDGVEIVVIDDGSDDGTGAALKPLAGKVRYYYQDNAGPAAARNLGIAKATGDYLAFLDSDDRWSPGKIARELDLFRRHPEADVVVGNTDAWREGQLRFASWFEARKVEFPGRRPRYFDWSLANLTLGPLCSTSAICLRRTALGRLGQPLFDATLRFDEDWDLEFRMFARCKVLFFPEVLSSVRVFDDGTRRHYSHSGKPKSREEECIIWETQVQILERYVGRVDWGTEAASRFSERRDALRRLLNSSPISA